MKANNIYIEDIIEMINDAETLKDIDNIIDIVNASDIDDSILFSDLFNEKINEIEKNNFGDVFESALYDTWEALYYESRGY